jgi:ABC-type branched-subunit amino acid transport system substrate-binding protein
MYKLLCLVFLLLAGCQDDVDQSIYPAPAANSVKIGLIVSSPPAQPSQSSAREYAALLAVEEINAAGGVNGQPVELVIAYDQNRTEAGIQAAQSLLQDNVVAIIGASTSRSTLALAQAVTIPADLPVLTHGGTSPALTPLADNDTVYRIPPSDTLQGRVLADLMHNEGVHKLAILYVDDAYGQGLRDTSQSRLEQQGDEVIATVAIAANRQRVSATQISALFAAGTPDAVAIYGLVPIATSAIREMLLLHGKLPKLYGTDALGGQNFLDNLIPEAAGMRLTTPTSLTTSPEYLLLANAYRKRLGFDLADLPTTYDAVYLVALAMAEGKSNTREAVKKHLRSVSKADSDSPVLIMPTQFAAALTAIYNGEDIDYQGAFSPIDFDDNGDPASAVYSYLEVQKDDNGRLKFVELRILSYSCTTCKMAFIEGL